MAFKRVTLLSLSAGCCIFVHAVPVRAGNAICMRMEQCEQRLYGNSFEKDNTKTSETLFACVNCAQNL